MSDGLKQNQIENLPLLGDNRYENLFKIYNDSDGNYYYNILKKVSFSGDFDDSFYFEYNVIGQKHWTIISYEVYGTIHLWWMICSVNGISNPVQLPESGITLKILKPEYVQDVLTSINVI